jgi:hypothetical protein
MDLKSRVAPNVYELSGDDSRIIYRTGESTADTAFVYSGPKGECEVSGEDVTVQETQLGIEVTVTLEDVADMHVVTLTAVLPEIWVEPGAGQEFETISVLTTKGEPITAPEVLPPARESYAVLEMSGEGKRTAP